MTLSKQRQKNLEKIKDFRLMDDVFMSACFSDNVKLTEFVLRIIMKKPDLVVTEVHTQKPLASLSGRGARLDVFATDSSGVKYNIEVQRASEGADPTRARYYSAMIDSKLLKPRQKIKELPECCVVFITEQDVLSGGRLIYHIERRIEEENRLFNDGEHIIYVNGAYEDFTTELGKLVHDMRCPDPDEMFLKPIAKITQYFKKVLCARLWTI